MQAAALSIEDVDFSYPNGLAVFRHFSLQVRPGEFIALLGPSGCGKTTLLNLLSGFSAPTRGSITVNGMAVRPEAPDLGYVFQKPQLFPWLTALDNVRFGFRMQGQLPRSEQTDRARHFLGRVGLLHAADKLPHQLSGGMQQRVALARTLALQPTLLLMDEPFAALDAITRGSMNEEILRLWSKINQTVLFITHDIDEAVFLADRIVLLDIAPRGIRSLIDIDLPRPRHGLETRRLPAYLAYRNALLEQISAVMQAA
jgi:NitT/TauT family transport system ATP-binding protein